VRATKVNAGLAESNGRLLLGLWRDSLHVTCGLTACTPGSAPGPTLGNEYGKTLPYTPKPMYVPVKNLDVVSAKFYHLHALVDQWQLVHSDTEVLESTQRCKLPTLTSYRKQCHQSTDAKIDGTKMTIKNLQKHGTTGFGAASSFLVSNNNSGWRGSMSSRLHSSKRQRFLYLLC